MATWSHLFRRTPAGQETGPLFSLKTTAVLAAMLGFLVAALFLFGRRAWCECGIGLWTGDPWSSSTSQHLADPYSFSHVLHGLLFYWGLTFFSKKMTLRERLLAAVALEIGWEILENTPMVIERYRSETASLDYFGDSVLNSLGDVASTVIGFWFASRLPWKASAAMFVALELIMLFTIRDNLTMNVLMLIYPIEAVREWQMDAPLSS